jgi:conjugal transfer pilin signal peptidase TrbI
MMAATRLSSPSAAHARANARASFARWARHLRRYWWAYALGAALLGTAYSFFHRHYLFGVNIGTSMPPALYFVERGVMPVKGEHVVFLWQGGGPFKKDSLFIKRVVGVEGDEVTTSGRTVLINGESISMAKTHSRKGEPLEMIQPGRIPAGRYYVHLDNPDSLDSRYAMTGLVDRSIVVGKTHVFFLP